MFSSGTKTYNAAEKISNSPSMLPWQIIRIHRVKNKLNKNINESMLQRKLSISLNSTRPTTRRGHRPHRPSFCFTLWSLERANFNSTIIAGPLRGVTSWCPWDSKSSLILNIRFCQVWFMILHKISCLPVYQNSYLSRCFMDFLYLSPDIYNGIWTKFL